MSYIGQNIQPISNQGTTGGDFDGVATLDNMVRDDLALYTKIIDRKSVV